MKDQSGLQKGLMEVQMAKACHIKGEYRKTSGQVGRRMRLLPREGVKRGGNAIVKAHTTP